MRIAPTLYDQTQQSDCLIRIRCIQDGADRTRHGHFSIEIGGIVLQVMLQVKLAALPRHIGKHRLSRSLEPSVAVTGDELDRTQCALNRKRAANASCQVALGQLAVGATQRCGNISASREFGQVGNLLSTSLR